MYSESKKLITKFLSLASSHKDRSRCYSIPHRDATACLRLLFVLFASLTLALLLPCVRCVTEYWRENVVYLHVIDFHAICLPIAE